MRPRLSRQPRSTSVSPRLSRRPRLMVFVLGSILCMWVLGLLLFITMVREGAFHPIWTYFASFFSSSSKGGAAAKAVNRVNLNQQQSHFFESISPELSPTGWKPIFLHSKNVRMSIQEMDYFMEKHWFPQIRPDDEGIKGAVDFSEVDHPKVGQRGKIDPHHADHDDPHDQVPRSVDGHQLHYPSDWSSSCFPSRVHDRDCIANHLRYWTKGTSLIDDGPGKTHKYVTFATDGGGWNNIRQVLHILICSSFHSLHLRFLIDL